MTTTTGLDIAAFGIAVVGFSLAVLLATAHEGTRFLSWRRPGRVAARYGFSIGLLAGVLALVSWGLAGYISYGLDQTNQNAPATPGIALLYFWLGVGMVHAPLAGLSVFRSTRRFGFGIMSGVLAGSLFAIGTAVGVILLITGLPSLQGTQWLPSTTLFAVALFSAVMVVCWIVPSAILAALGCLGAMIMYPAGRVARSSAGV
jgi:hypothetical protein